MISIVIPCRNERDRIGPLLDSLETQHMPGEWEAIVADGMSDDGTREVLAERSRRNPRIHVIDNVHKIVSTGLNQAIREASGDIILRMDAHSEYAPDYVLRCVQELDASGAENAGGPARTKASGMLQRAIAAAYHSRFSTGGASFHDESHEGFVDTVPYGCWRKSTLERIGLFDEALVRNQDDELNLRLIRAGGKIWQSPKIVSWYRPRNSFGTLFRQYCQYGFWKVEVIRKHWIPASWRHLVPAAFVLGNALLLLTAAMAAIAGNQRGGVALVTLWLTGIAVYGAACVAASLPSARKYGWSLLPLLPVVFAIYHLSYGIGFAANLARHFFGASTTPRAARAFTSLSR